MINIPTIAEMRARTGKAEVLVNTIFGPVIIEGPFADDYTKLNWKFTDHRDGETAEFRVAGLELFVQDMDGDGSWWHLKDVRTRKVLAKGDDWGFDPPHFWKCLAEAEATLRAEVNRRKEALRGPR